MCEQCERQVGNKRRLLVLFEKSCRLLVLEQGAGNIFILPYAGSFSSPYDDGLIELPVTACLVVLFVLRHLIATTFYILYLINRPVLPCP